MKIRSFISIDVEDPDLLAKIGRVQEEIAATGAIMKLVERGNIHLTLRFLGEITPHMVKEVIKVLDTIKFTSFVMRIEGLGAFPERSRRPRVIWLGITEGKNEVCQIYEQIEKELRKLGFPHEKGKFTPHITIARVKRVTPQLLKVINDLRDVYVGDMIVEAVRLKKSTLTRKGPIYETLYEVRAQKAA